MTKPVRFSCVVPYTNRESAASGTALTLYRDTCLVNCLSETVEGKKLAIKRPGMSIFASYNGGAATNGQGTVSYKDLIFAMGSNTLYRITAALFGSASGTAWTASTSAPWLGRNRFGCVVFNGQIFIMGGENAAGFAFLNDVWSSPDGINWTQVVSAAPWIQRCEFGLVVLGNTMYLIGGRGNGASFSDVWSTPDGVTWTLVTGSAAFAARFGFGCVPFNQGIFVLGGFTAGNYINDVWFSSDGTNWTQMVVTASWGIRDRLNAISYAGKIWVLGGYNGANLADVWSSPDGINWTNTGSLPAVRSEMNICVYANAIFMLGGSPATQTVWSTTDGITFTVVAASYGGANSQGGALVPFRTPTTINPLNAATMWLIGGAGAGYTNTIYRANLNVAYPSSFAIGTAGATTDQFKFATQNAGDYLVFKNTSDAWVLYAGKVRQITDSNYPKSTVPGLVNLDDTLYVMGADGTIYGSNLSTPFVWSALNFITAEYESDVGVSLNKYLNYIVAFKSLTTQFFYDAGRFPGSPLLPILNATARVGCAAAGSVVSTLNSLVFMAQTASQGRYIAVLGGQGGFTPTSISNPSVNRVLNTWNTLDPIHAWAARLDGHDLYLITCAGQVNNTPLWTLIYDFTENHWGVWTDTTGSFFNGINYVTNGNADLLQDISLGLIYGLSTNIYQDNGVNFTAVGQLEKLDGGTNKRKFGSSVTVIGDRRAATAPNNVLVTWSDDDNQTFNTGVTVDITTERPRIARPGSFFRRSYRFDHTSNNPLRLEAIELEIIGSDSNRGGG